MSHVPRDATRLPTGTARQDSSRDEQDALDFLDNVGVALHRVGPDGIILWANQAELDMLGYRREEYVGRHIGDFHADQQVLDDILSRLSRRETLRNYPARMCAKDGSVREVQITSSALIEKDELVHTRCFTVDVTEQKRARAATALLAAIVDSSDDAIVSKSLDGIIVSWNPGAERLFGYRAAEAVGQSIMLIIPPELRDEERTILERLERGEKIDHYETVRVNRDGERIDISLTISPVRDADGRIIGASKVARDITERERAEEARRRIEATLRESEGRLRQVIDALPAAIYTTDAEGRIGHFNTAAINLAGRTPNPETDRWCVSWKLYRPDGTPLPHDQCPMAKAVKEGRAIRDAEIVVERPDGSRAWAAVYPTPLHDSAGNVTGAINMLVDVTGRKQSEQALRDQTLIAETLNRVGSTLAAELDLERIVQFVTDEATAVTTAEFGAFFHNLADEHGESYELYTLSGVLRESFATFPMPRNTAIFDPTFRGEKAVRIDDVTQDARYGRSPPYHGMPPGHLPVKSYLAVPMVSRSGEVLGGLFLGHAQPGVFTERHERIVSGIAAQAAIAMDNARLYAQVQDSEQRFRQFAERITDVFWMIDARTSRLLYVSPAYESLWGQTSGTLYANPRSFVEAIHPDDRNRVLASMERQLRGETTGEEYRIVHGDGTVRWVWDRGYPIRDENGRLVRVAGVAEDITERKLAEERLKEADRRKDEFLATLSHELRNPLAPLRHTFEIVKRTGGDDVRVLRESLATMERQVGQMVHLIDDLLDVSRITHDKLELRKETVELAAVVHQAVETSGYLIEEAGHTLVVNLPDEPVWLHADPVRLTQVLGNLLSNACKFMAPGGELRVTAERGQGDVVLTVQDNGDGIAADKLAVIFEMFAQADRSMERTQSGLGIGLTLVKRLVEMHGGSVEAFSEGPGFGSRFVVRLPAAAEDIQTPDPGKDNAVNGAQTGACRRVLVVDDNRDSAQALATLLSMTGHQTDCAFDGLEAIDAAHRFRPDVMLLDLGLPRMNGYDVCCAVRREPWGRDIAMVALTGWGQDQDRQRTREAGFDDHLVKPVDLAAIESLLAALPRKPAGPGVQ